MLMSLVVLSAFWDTITIVSVFCVLQIIGAGSGIMNHESYSTYKICKNLESLL